MKKLWLVFGLLVFAGACSDKQEEQNPEKSPVGRGFGRRRTGCRTSKLRH